jgi:phytoene/squalene synthetase
MVALAPTISSRRLPPGPFKRLLEANRQDQRVTRYATFAQLLDYCSLSAAPVGELVLHVFGAATPERVALSDRVCAGLQVLEHLQDVAEDYERGRVYLPQEDLARAGVAEAELREGAPAALLALEHERVSRLLDSGAPLSRTLPLRPRVAVAGFIAGGRTALDAVLRGGSRRRRVFAVALAKAAMGR